MAYTAQNFDNLLGLKGFSDQLLQNHFKLYQGYVTNTNKLIELLDKLESGTPEYSELQRRFGWEFNGMRMHELYFGNMIKGGKALNKNSSLAKELIKTYDSLENWEKNFKAVGAMRGIGWAALVYDQKQKEFFNLWINEHDVGHLAGTVPLLIMDVFEHAFMLDYGLNRADYIKAFMEAVDWDAVQKRFEKAQH
ncbi:MAG: Fe-Mn family superoxide dismutase [Nanoarchaeota archaeon]|nr:Fe-Mn family superoxide dismutase [Nanoarchaeota archaeon]